ncbi:MAG: hypothetical protein ACRENU_12585 [Gemmatimonadaceae bacterium]
MQQQSRSRFVRPERAQEDPRAAIRNQLDALNQQRSELQAQQSELSRRRNQLDEQRHQASGPARAQLEARIAEIDARTARLDAQLQQVNDRIVETMSRLTDESPVVVDVPQIRIPPITIPNIPAMNFPQRRGPDMGQIGGMMAAEAVLLALIGFVFWRVGMKRMREQFERIFSTQSQQLTQLQQAMDVIGIEVERISEGQRYVAKVLTEGSAEGVAPGARKELSPASRQG